MLIKDTRLTKGLFAWLREAHDDGTPALRVEQRGADVEVLRADGSDPSPDELREIQALLAANAAEPL